MYAVKRAGTNDFAEKIHSRVVHDSHMVRVPTDRTAHVEHQFRHEKQHSRNLVGNAFGGVEVTGVKSDHHVVLGCIRGVEVIASHSVAFKTDTEHLGLNAVLHPVILMLENLVKRILKQLAIHIAVDSDVLASVMYPCVHDTRILLSFTDSL